MKRFLQENLVSFLMVLAVVVACAVYASRLTAMPEKEAKPDKFGNIDAQDIKAKSITVTSEDGKNSITIAASKRTVGLWVNGHNSRKGICIVSDGELYPYIGLSDADSDGCPVALSYDKDGKPYIQIVRGKGEKPQNTTFINLDDLANFAK